MSDPSGAGNVPNDGAAYRDLVTRLLMMRAGRRRDLGTPEVFPGSVAPALDIDLPTLPGTRLVGSLVEGPRVTLVYASPQESAETSMAYYDALTAAGWHVVWPGGRRMGGLHHDAPTSGEPPSRERARWGHMQYFRAHADPLLDVNVAADPEAGHATLEVQVDRDTENPMRRFVPTASQGEDTPILPTVSPPPMGGQDVHGSSASAAGASSFGIVAAASHTLAQIAAHYEQQLTQAGWQRTAGATEPLAAWSIWTFTRDGQPWRGMLMFALLREQPVLRATITLRADYIGDAAHPEPSRASTTFGSRLLGVQGHSVVSATHITSLHVDSTPADSASSSEVSQQSTPQEGSHDATHEPPTSE